ncbi:hypothetical protein GX50_05543, partial [[Emmonsia] crescens]
MKISIILSTALALFTASTSALGTNCFGRQECQSDGCQLSHILDSVLRYDPYRLVVPGELIACCGPGSKGKGTLCAYTQHTTKLIHIYDVVSHIRALQKYGCRRCGSAAFDGKDVFK